MINKDTKIYGSFAETSGNNGCRFFNAAFIKHNLDAIYRSYSVNSIELAVLSARTLGFSGFAISMPFKIDILNYVDDISEEVCQIGSSNTVVNLNGRLIAYNTDYHAGLQLLENLKKEIYILGSGGLSKAIQASAKKLSLPYQIITRDNWDLIETLTEENIINCTPIDVCSIHKSNNFLDLRVATPQGTLFSRNQALHQFFLYTGILYA
tara:strand:+ start:4187 stop:4813 length:627 start_codon:yes stop_codon:yes gene_type:complete